VLASVVMVVIPSGQSTRRSLYATAGKSISVSLMRLKTLVKTVVANARLISTSCASCSRRP
jgi:hypothetical protein